MRKQHNTEAGYVAERANPHAPGRKVVIYVAEAQGIDAGAKYAVVCDEHATILGVASVPSARAAMKAPESFCEGCRGLM